MDLTTVGSEFLSGTEAKTCSTTLSNKNFPNFAIWGDTSLGKILVFLLVAGSNTSFLLSIFGLTVFWFGAHQEVNPVFR